MICILSKDIDEESLYNLKSITKDIIFIEQYDNLYPAIRSHADIQCCVLDKTHIIVQPSINKETIIGLGQYNVNITFGDKELGLTYPDNIFYNASIVGDNIIHYYNYTDNSIKREVGNRRYNIINTKQGYSKCSILTVNENSIITSDKNIAESVQKAGLDVLVIRSGNILLTGLNYGFIGGTCGTLADEKLIVFNGDITMHPDYESILDFIKSKGMDYICLSSKKLMDIGSILFL